MSLDVVQQSKNAYNQWCEIWRENAKKHSEFEMRPMSDLKSIGIGRAILAVANGYSFEKNVEVIKEHKHEDLQVMACDKTLGHLLDQGIRVDYCIVCDANVNYEKYMEPWKDQLQDTTLLMNVCGNTQWSMNGNWKNTYFFVNKDVMNYEKEFSRISGCQNFIPAGTNVSNAMIIYLTQSDNSGPNNFMGFDKINLIGFDYSWLPGGHYYSFDPDGGGKFYYMKHVVGTNIRGDLCYTSSNLLFSAKWLEKYCKTFNLPIIQCSKDGIMNPGRVGDLKEQISYSYKPEDSEKVRKLLDIKGQILDQIRQIDHKLLNISMDHHLAVLRSV